MAYEEAVRTTSKSGRASDISVAVIIAIIVMMLIVPLPPFVMDVLITLNLILSIVILLLTLYSEQSLELSVFPSLLLITTIFRLSLYIGTTRLILSRGEAGVVVQAFGSAIIAGNYIVGIIIFIILVLIQFVVVTQGTTRISEVAARFTLDAMPGKQMAIDADLNAGLITEEEARQRRRDVENEADFFGAMDGASKFVKGDAVAGIIIVVVNLIGGFAIGALQFNMDILTSLQTFGTLAIGAGLAIQIPALLFSTAAGALVTRAASVSPFGEELTTQLFARPKSLGIAASLLVLFGLVPGLPKLPFFGIAAMAGIAYYFVGKPTEPTISELEEARQEEEARLKTPESLIGALQFDIMELDIGYGLIPLVDPDQGGELLDRITLMRRQIALELGYVVPPIRIRDDIQLNQYEYIVKIKGVNIAKGSLMLDRFLAIESGLVKEKIDGIPTKEPAFGLPALWIIESQRENAEILGYTVVDPASVVITHLSEIIKKHAHELLGRQDVQTLLENIKQNYPIIVDELTPNLMTVGEIQKVLQNLLREKVSIRDMVTILETLGNYASAVKDINVLTEYVRQAMGRNICNQYQVDGKLHVITIAPELEKEIGEAIQHTEKGVMVALEPSEVQKIISNLSASLEKLLAQGHGPILLCSPDIRLPFKTLTERFIPELIVLSYNEIVAEIELKVVGVVNK
ncbi:MAG TPA: flagellar biosynthesis protein FlhA [Actinobacteria bacterium]|nr:flagellar biosynthesis protein FlhA [Actinomycetota bacterium]